MSKKKNNVIKAIKNLYKADLIIKNEEKNRMGVEKIILHKIRYDIHLCMNKLKNFFM